MILFNALRILVAGVGREEDERREILNKAVGSAGIKPTTNRL